MKISLQLNLSKIDKNKIKTRTYTNKDGEEISVKEYNCDLLELKVPRVIKTGDGWVMKKTHILVESQTKEERASGKKSATIGNGIMFDRTENVQTEEPSSVDYPEDDIDADDIPF